MLALLFKAIAASYTLLTEWFTFLDMHQFISSKCFYLNEPVKWKPQCFPPLLVCLCPRVFFQQQIYLQFTANVGVDMLLAKKKKKKEREQKGWEK